MKTHLTRALRALAPVALGVASCAAPGPVRADVPAPADGRPRATPAAAADTAVVEIEGLSVMGRRPGATRGGSSVVRAALDSLPLPAAATLREVLEELPAVHVRTNSRGETEISLRGSESRQVAVLYDGLPLTLSWDGRTDVSVIPVGAMQQVALVPGLASLLSGPNVLGGVIDFQSTAAGRPGRPGLQAGAGVDEVGGFGASVAITAPRDVRGGTLTVRAGLGHRDTPGVPLAEGVQQPLAAVALRINTDATSTDGFAALRYEQDGGAWASVSSAAFRERRGIAAELGVASPRYWRYPLIARSLTVLSAGSGPRRAPWGGATRVQASFGLDAGRTEIDAFDSIGYDAISGEDDGEQRTLSMRAVASQTLGRDADLRIGVTSSQLTYDERLTPGTGSRYRHRLWSVAGEGILRRPVAGGGPLDEVNFALGAAFDRSTYPLAGDKPGIDARDEPGGRAGMSAVFAGGAVTAHASASRRARFPSLRELYSGALNRFTPNPGLRPEQLRAVEAGITLRDGRGSLQVVGFAQRLADAVVRVRESGRFRRVNQEGLRSRGLEFVGTRRFGHLSLGANLTAQSSELLDPSASLDRPENLPGLSGGLHAEMRVLRGVTLGASVRHTGEQFALDPNDGTLASLPAGTRVNVNLGREWPLGAGDGWATSLRALVVAENLTDRAVYDSYGLPGPGRLLRFELRLQ